MVRIYSIKFFTKSLGIGICIRTEKVRSGHPCYPLLKEVTFVITSSKFLIYVEFISSIFSYLLNLRCCAFFNKQLIGDKNDGPIHFYKVHNIFLYCMIFLKVFVYLNSVTSISLSSSIFSSCGQHSVCSVVWMLHAGHLCFH